MSRLFFQVFVLLALLPVGCSRDTEPLPRAREVNLLIAADPTEESFIRAQIEDFEKFNWNAKIRLSVRPPGFPLAQELSRIEDKGQPIDLIIFDAGELAGLASGGRLLNMSQDSRFRSIMESIDSGLLDRLSGGDGLVALPFFWSTAVLVYDKRIFDQMGMSYPSEYWGWPDVLEAAQAATMDTDRDGRKDQFGLELRGAADEVIMMFWQFEGVLNPQPEAKSIGEVVAAQGRLILEQTIDFYADMAEEMNVAVVSERPMPQGLLGQGRVAMGFAQWRDLVALSQLADREFLQIAPAPRGREKATLLQARLMGIPKSSQRKLEALAVMSFLLRVDAQRSLAAEGVGLPVLSELSEDRPQGSLSRWDMNSFYEQLPHAQIAPDPAVMAEIQKILDERLSSGVRVAPDSDERPPFRSRLKLRLDSGKK